MTTRQIGELADWNDDRGFGFIRPDGASGRVFVYVGDIRRMVNRPRVGDRLSYVLGKGRDGRPAALEVKIDGANPFDRSVLRRGAPVAQQPAWPTRVTLRLAAAAGLLALAVSAIALGRAPSWLAIVYLGAGVVSVCAYWIDKHAAESGHWRIREATLHVIDLWGGIAGGLVAQALLRHKTSKPGFAVVTAGIVALHLCALTILLVGL